jgi:uncharacterized protein (DUF433 family)
MRPLHHVITKSPRRQPGGAVFAGTRVAVRALVEHLDQGGDVESFLGANGGADREVVNAAIALGLEALLQQVPPDVPPAQRSLLPRLDASGAITNAEELRADQVIGKKVLCPSCRRLVFKSWPEGWDGHAAERCRGIARQDARARKAEYKARFGYLFRS